MCRRASNNKRTCYGTMARRKSLVLLRPMSHLRFYRATLSRDKIASVTYRVAQLSNSRWTLLLNRAAVLCSIVSRMLNASPCSCEGVAVCEIHSCILHPTTIYFALYKCTHYYYYYNFVARLIARQNRICHIDLSLMMTCLWRPGDPLTVWDARNLPTSPII